MKTFKRFVKSYNKYAKGSLARPIVYYDGDNKEYHKLIDSMNPIEKIKQGVFPSKQFGAYSNTIDYKAIWEFPKIIAQSAIYKKETVLFLEDDIEFSSRFEYAVNEVEKQFRNYPVVDIVTFYGSGQCYWPSKNNKAKHPIYKFDGKGYYGNLAVAFSPKTMNWWYNHRHDVWNNNYAGWDIKLGNVFEQNGFNFYCTNKHYVQHQVGYSVIAKSHKRQQSDNFVR
jgi:hypothetical protein